MFKFSVVKTDEITPLLERLNQSGPVVRGVAARAAAKFTRQHLALLGQTRHRRSGGALNFYADAARKTTGRVVSDDIVITVDKEGMRQRYYGGTIRATRRKYLAIPTDDATGMVPRDFDRLKFAPNKAGGGRLMDDSGRVLFWLKKSVTQKADPSVMPSDSDFVEVIEPSVQEAINQMTVAERGFRSMGWDNG